MKYYFDQLTFERMVVERLKSSQPSKSKKIELSLKFDLKILFSDNVGLPSFKALLLLIQLERTKKLKLLLSSLLMLRIVLSFSFSFSLSLAQCLSRFLSLSHVASPSWFLSSQGSFFWAFAFTIPIPHNLLCSQSVCAYFFCQLLSLVISSSHSTSLTLSHTQQTLKKAEKWTLREQLKMAFSRKKIHEFLSS